MELHDFSSDLHVKKQLQPKNYKKKENKDLKKKYIQTSMVSV